MKDCADLRRRSFGEPRRTGRLSGGLRWAEWFSGEPRWAGGTCVTLFPGGEAFRIFVVRLLLQFQQPERAIFGQRHVVVAALQRLDAGTAAVGARALSDADRTFKLADG